MGRIMMNGIQYGTGGRPTAEGVTYDNAESGITATNVQGAVDELSNGLSDKYSTNEKIVGEWIDGKPIYRKTYLITSGFSSGMTVANLTAMNVETVVSIAGMLSRSEGITITIPNGNPQAAYNAYAADVNGVLQVGYGSSITPRKILLSIMYTKTTD